MAEDILKEYTRFVPFSEMEELIDPSVNVLWYHIRKENK